MSRFTPHLEILPERQRRLWPKLAGLTKAGFVLYGGTAIVLRFGHRDGTLDGVALLASPLDLLATKLKVLLQRAEWKVYQDVATLLASGLALSDGLAGARPCMAQGFRLVNVSRPWCISPMVTCPNWAAANGASWSGPCWPLT